MAAPVMRSMRAWRVAVYLAMLLALAAAMAQSTVVAQSSEIQKRLPGTQGPGETEIKKSPPRPKAQNQPPARDPVPPPVASANAKADAKAPEAKAPETKAPDAKGPDAKVPGAADPTGLTASATAADITGDEQLTRFSLTLSGRVP